MTDLGARLSALIATFSPHMATGAEFGPDAVRRIVLDLQLAAYDVETLERTHQQTKTERDELLAIAHEIDLWGLAEADAKRKEQEAQLRRVARPSNVVLFPPRRPLYASASPGGAA